MVGGKFAVDDEVVSGGVVIKVCTVACDGIGYCICIVVSSSFGEHGGHQGGNGGFVGEPGACACDNGEEEDGVSLIVDGEDGDVVCGGDVCYFGERKCWWFGFLWWLSAVGLLHIKILFRRGEGWLPFSLE